MPINAQEAGPPAGSRKTNETDQRVSRISPTRPVSQTSTSVFSRRKPGPPRGCPPRGGVPARPVLERFLEKVDRAGPDGHWLWIPPLVRSVRTELKVAGKVESAARVSWALFRGPLPDDGRVVKVRCRERACVNPAHLTLGKHGPIPVPKAKKYGPAKPRGRRPLSVNDRVWRGVVAQTAPEHAAHLGPCLIPTKQKPNTNGYVMFLIDGRWVPAHRIAWELANCAKIPRSLVADHICEVRSCRSPLHIRPCTQAKNLERSRSRLQATIGASQDAKAVG